MSHTVADPGPSTRNVTHKRTRSPNGQARVALNVRVRPEARQALDTRATREGLDRSEMARRALAYSMRFMPDGWTP